MNLTAKNYNKFEKIKTNMESGKASNNDILDFLEFTLDGDNENTINQYIESIGLTSVDDYKAHLNNKIENRKFVKNLAIVGGAILLAYLIIKK